MIRHLTPAVCLAAACLLAAAAWADDAQENRYDLIIRGGRVYEGSGTPWIRADLAIRGDRIAAMGRLADAQADRVIDADGLFVAPGFIDTHSHAWPGLSRPELSKAHALLAQGITTVFINSDGGASSDLADQREKLLEHGLGVNVGQFIGHTAVRRAAMSNVNREATPEELEKMRELVERGMNEGAFGLATGLWYPPAASATTEEVIELAKVASRYGGVYQSHIRDESDYTIGLVAAVEELIQIVREAEMPGVVTHIKVGSPHLWGLSRAVVERIEQARQQGVEVFADQYPYTASSTGMQSVLANAWVMRGGAASLKKRIEDEEELQQIREIIAENLKRRGGPGRIQMRSYSPEPEVEGKFLSDIAEARKQDPVDVAIEMLANGRPAIISHSMDDGDVIRFMRRPWTMTASDGSLVPLGHEVPHPRSYGTFPRRLQHYSLETGVVDFAHSIRSMTAMPALVYRMKDRGFLREGALADIVVFDKKTLKGPADYTNPHQHGEGMVHVLVNGQLAIDNGEFTDALAGQALRRDRQ